MSLRPSPVDPSSGIGHDCSRHRHVRPTDSPVPAIGVAGAVVSSSTSGRAFRSASSISTDCSHYSYSFCPSTSSAGHGVDVGDSDSGRSVGPVGSRTGSSMRNSPRPHF